MTTAKTNGTPASKPPSLQIKPTFADYINRELSWLEFNARVLAEASNDSVPVYERLKFLGIFASNLDEFFMVRVAGLQAQLSGEIADVTPDGMTPEEQLAAISKRAHELTDQSARIWSEDVLPRLQEVGVALVKPEELDEADLANLDAYFATDIYPVLTPIAIDPVHPFPHVRNKSINVGVIFSSQALSLPGFGVVQVPTTLSRLIRIKGSKERVFVALEDLILRHLNTIFPQLEVVERYAFRVTRNFDIEIDDDEAEDLLSTLKAELRRREQGHAVRLEVSGKAPKDSIRWLCNALGLNPSRDVYFSRVPLFFGDLMGLSVQDERRALRDEPFFPQYVPPLRDSEDFFETIRKGDVLLHHPYESFEAVVDFLGQAAEDPNVLAIKQTLYRTGGESPMVRALQRAAELGKQVTTLVELKARFDEESNIQWAHALERSGVNVMYGLLGLKTHAKVMLVVRKEETGLRRYVHLATGNYNQQTARLYEDLSLFTARPEIGEDATAFFNMLTGYSSPAHWNRFIVAPLGLHEAILGLITRELSHAQNDRPAGICAKMNSLVDAEVIAALYAASRAGVQVDLLVRGICCLRPGVEGLSENIRVHAVIDRFLEHARIFHFKNGGDDEVYCSSADWMPRNFRRRVEVMFPIIDPKLRQRVIEEVLETMRTDDTKGWLLQPTGEYLRAVPRKGEVQVHSQQRFMELARERTRENEGFAGLKAPNLAHPLGKLRRKKTKGQKKKKRES